MATAPDSAFGPIWCAWGYGRNVQLKQVYDTLPTAKKLGFSWVTLDDGWQNNYGDWELDPKKFPNGDADMKALVDQIHARRFQSPTLVVAAERRPGFKVAERSSRLRSCSIATDRSGKFPGGILIISAHPTGGRRVSQSARS